MRQNLAKFPVIKNFFLITNYILFLLTKVTDTKTKPPIISPIKDISREIVSEELLNAEIEELKIANVCG